MKRVFAIVLAAACIIGSTPSFARGGGAGGGTRIWSRRVRTKSDDAVGSIPGAESHVPKPHSGAARGAFAGTRDQWTVGAEPVWRRYVSAPAGPSFSNCSELLAASLCVGCGALPS